MTGDARILVVGGGSRIAAQLATLLDNRTVFVSQRPSGHRHEFLVPDYASVPIDAFKGAACVINCVGTHRGDPSELHRVNVEIAASIAGKAKEAGAGQLIHLSSFSVFGRAHRISQDTRPAPRTDYGRSRLAGDSAVLKLADETFAVAILRLPLIYAVDTPGKLGQMMRLWSRVRVMPLPRQDVRRSMISTRLAAEVIERLTRTRRAEVVLAADPRPFTYADAAAAWNKRLRRLPLPRAITVAAERLAPEIGGRIFADSHLADADNLAITEGLRSHLYEDIARIGELQGRGSR